MHYWTRSHWVDPDYFLITQRCATGVQVREPMLVVIFVLLYALRDWKTESSQTSRSHNHIVFTHNNLSIMFPVRSLVCVGDPSICSWSIMGMTAQFVFYLLICSDMFSIYWETGLPLVQQKLSVRLVSQIMNLLEGRSYSSFPLQIAGDRPRLFEGLSASGLRAIRYAQEVRLGQAYWTHRSMTISNFIWWCADMLQTLRSIGSVPDCRNACKVIASLRFSWNLIYS